MPLFKLFKSFSQAKKPDLSKSDFCSRFCHKYFFEFQTDGTCIVASKLNLALRRKVIIKNIIQRQTPRLLSTTRAMMTTTIAKNIRTDQLIY